MTQRLTTPFERRFRRLWLRRSEIAHTTANIAAFVFSVWLIGFLMTLCVMVLCYVIWIVLLWFALMREGKRQTGLDDAD